MSDRIFIEAIGRNPGEEKGRSHLYEDNGDYYEPMCRHGWNRSNGAAFSIFRGHSGGLGTCKVCQRRKDAGLPSVPAKPGSHKTKWL